MPLTCIMPASMADVRFPRPWSEQRQVHQPRRPRNQRCAGRSQVCPGQRQPQDWVAGFLYGRSGSNLMSAPSFRRSMPWYPMADRRGCSLPSPRTCLSAISPPLSWILARMVLTGASIIMGVNLFKADPLNTAGKLDRIPTLFIHGEKDRYTTAEEIKTMVSLAGPNARLWSVPEAKHRNIETSRPEEYLQVVISFFSENL